MKGKKVIIFASIVLTVLVMVSIGSSHQLSSKQPSSLREENPLSITIQPGFLSRGCKIVITNEGTEPLSNVEWCFSVKPVITALIGKGDVCHQTMDQLEAGEARTYVLRPYLSPDMPSPRGLGRVYCKAQVKANSTEVVRDQKQAFLLFNFMVTMKETYIDIPPAEAYDLYLNDTFDLIIDVVGLDIYSLGHLPGAVNYIWADGTLESTIPELDKNGTYLVYCHTNPPSTASAQALVDAGIENTYRLEGNYRAWVEAGYPVET